MAGILHRVIPGLCLEGLCSHMALLYTFLAPLPDMENRQSMYSVDVTMAK